LIDAVSGFPDSITENTSDKYMSADVSTLQPGNTKMDAIDISAKRQSEILFMPRPPPLHYWTPAFAVYQPHRQ
jgi:hypothetical protein